MRLAIPILAFLLPLMPVAAVAESTGAVSVTRPWARASLGKIGAAYVTLSIRSGAGDVLVGVSSEAAGRVEIHTHRIDSRGIARMLQLTTVAVKPGAPVVFHPGGLHLMLFNLKSPLKQGAKLPLTLNFKHAGKVRVTAHILGMGSRGPKTK